MSEGKNLPDLSGLLEQITANPAALNMLTSLLGNKPPPPTAKEAQEASPTVALPTPLPLPPVSRDRRISFLQAMRPFLNGRGQDLVDRMVKMSEMIAVFHTVARR